MSQAHPHLLTVGLPLSLRAELIRLLPEAVWESATDGAAALEKLAEGSFSGLALHETVVTGSLFHFLERVGEGFSGHLILCSEAQKEEEELVALVRQGHVALLVYPPFEAVELARSFALALDLRVEEQTSINGAFTEQEQRQRLWRAHRGELFERLENLDLLVAARRASGRARKQLPSCPARCRLQRRAPLPVKPG